MRGVLRARGVRGAITSPSFTLAQSYHGRDGEVLHHLDLYRLSRGADAELFAWDDYLGPDAITFVEWPAAGSDALPPADLRIQLEHRTLNSRGARLVRRAGRRDGCRTRGGGGRDQGRPGSRVVILALETATAACSAALCAADGSVVAERVSLDGPAHSQLLLPYVHEILAEAGAGWDAVETVAVGLGPGAFTGLRIGIATARALAQADGAAALAGVPTLAALALALADAPEAPGRRLVPLIDGRRREVFAAVFEAAPGGGVRQTEGVAVVPADGLAEWLAARGDVVTGGDGAVLYGELLPASARPAAGVVAPTAAMVGRAVACGAPGLVRGPDAVLPLYGRAPDAKPRPAAPPPAGGAS